MSEEPEQKTKKRKNTEDNGIDENPTKKTKADNVMENFRNQLNSIGKSQALESFLHEINTNPDIISSYLRQGGTVLEILKTTEDDPNVAPTLLFEVVSKMLLNISAKLKRYHNGAHEACQHLLSNYVPLLNRMLSLSSSTIERQTCLKLLTTIVTISALLAKDVLINVNFNPSNLELLTKSGPTRNAFVHFLLAFLVVGHFPTLSVLLEKKGLLTSILKGLQTDNANLVTMVLTAMKNHILENTSVSKTVKMKIFNTPAVKIIVNLYNWKGPSKAEDLEKSKVNEAVHSFLLTLCTSHKFGVVFKDQNMGLGRKNQNILMYTVVDSLERPWEHSYARDLVIKICRASPDLTKTVWTSLNTFLEPRWTPQWQKAINFAGEIISELDPSCLEFVRTSLTSQQLGHAILNLIAPVSILKTLVTNPEFEKAIIKQEICIFLSRILESMKNYTNSFSEKEVIQIFINHTQKHFPNSALLLRDWDSEDEETSINSRLEITLDLLNKYRVFAPKLLEDLSSNFDVNLIISRIPLELKVTTGNFFLNLDPSLFRTTTDLFETVLKLALEYYHESQSEKVLLLLRKLLQNSGVFDGTSSEIDIWINGILNAKSYNSGVADFLLCLLRRVEKSPGTYDPKMSVSPLLSLVSDCVSEDFGNVTNYLNFVAFNLYHKQIELMPFRDIVGQWSFLSDEVQSYITEWSEKKSTKLNKIKGKLMSYFHKFSTEFFDGDFNNFDSNLYPNLKLDALQTVIFYFGHLLRMGELSTKHIENSQKFIRSLEISEIDERFLDVIFENRIILEDFSIKMPLNEATVFLNDVIKHVQTQKIPLQLEKFRTRIVTTLIKFLKKPSKYESTSISIDMIESLDLNAEHCVQILENFSRETFLFEVACLCLNKASVRGTRQLSFDTIRSLCGLLQNLIETQPVKSHLFSAALLNYLKVYPHNLEVIDDELIEALFKMSEFYKDNLSLCEFLLERKPALMKCFEKNFNEVKSKRSFILSLLNVVLRTQNEDLLKDVFESVEPHIIKALQKPHKAGNQFHNCYESLGVLIEKFLVPKDFGGQVMKFDSTDLFHVHLLTKVFDKVEKTDKTVTNMVLTLLHLIANILKGKNTDNWTAMFKIILKFFETIKDSFDLRSLSSKEIVKVFCKLALKYGVADEVILLEILTQIVTLCIEEEDGHLLLEMMMSHSQFFDVVLSDIPKSEIMKMWGAICKKFPLCMERNHVPILLSAYRGINADAAILSLLKMYESASNQTKFHDFKPFVWGRAAASLYSVRSDLSQVLWRQPKLSDVLNNLHNDTIAATITNPTEPTSYDLNYFLPLFGHLLAPENPVPTYRFTKSGALALTLVGFRGNKLLRSATCHVLHRFHFHLNAKQIGKDNKLWVRFLEVICKGVDPLDLKINNFVGLFLSRAALILTQPKDVMYLPISQYLSAKDTLDFTSIPELYTYLHNPDVNSTEYRAFILELVRDGIKTEKDFTIFLKSMAFKLISELFSSNVANTATKLLILDVFKKCCELPLGVKVLCQNLSFLSQIVSLFSYNLKTGAVVKSLLEILFQLVEKDADRHRNYIIYLNLSIVISDRASFECVINSKGLDTYFGILLVLVKRFPDFFVAGGLEDYLGENDDSFCRYITENGCDFVSESDASSSNLRQFFFYKLRAAK